MNTAIGSIVTAASAAAMIMRSHLVMIPYRSDSGEGLGDLYLIAFASSVLNNCQLETRLQLHLQVSDRFRTARAKSRRSRNCEYRERAV